MGNVLKEGQDRWQADLSKDTVLVRVGCYNRIPQVGAFRNSKHLFLTALEAGIFRIEMPAGLGSDEGPLPHCRLSSQCNLLAGV